MTPRPPSAIRTFFTRAAPLAALVALWALFFWRFAAPNPADRVTYVPGDFSETFGVFRDLGYRAFVEGRLALWADCLWSGYPLHADPQAQTFYPVKWLTYSGLRLLGYGHFPLEALVAETAAHYLLTSLGLYAFLRSRALRAWAAVLGAVTFTYGGYLTGYPPLQNAVLAVNAWTPLALWAAGRLGEARTLRALALTALVLAVAFLAGHPQTFLFTALITGAYFTFRYCAAPPAPPLRFAALGLALGALTAALAAVQLLPSLEFIAASTRASVAFAQAAHGFPFQDLAQMLIPGIASVWSPLYVGVLPLALAIFAVTRPLPEVRFWAGAALASLVLSFGTAAAAYDAAYWFIPGLALFRGAERLALITSLALAVLAAFGAHYLLGGLARSERAVLRRITWGVAVIAVVAVAALVTVMALAYGGVSGLEWGALPDLLGRWALVAALTLAALLGRGRVPALRAWTPALFVAVVAVDLFSANRPLNVQPLYTAYAPDAVVAPLQADPAFFRVQDDARLPGHSGCAYGYRAIEGVTPYKLAAYERLLSLPERTRWALLGVRYVTTWRGELLDAQGRRIESEVVAQSERVDERGNPTRTHRLAQAARCAWLAGQVDVISAPDQLAARLAEPDFDPFTTAVLPTASVTVSGTAASGGEVATVQDAPGSLRFDVAADGAAVLVVSEAYFSGWRVSVDDQPAEVLTVDGALLGVAVPAGRHHVAFTYQPMTLTLGATLSALALAAAGLAFAPASLGRRRPGARREG